MTLTALREDALRTTPEGFALRLSLPWIRSLPLASLVDLAVAIDGAAPSSLLVAVGDRTLTPSALAFERGWWFLQDRLVIRGRTPLGRGAHRISVSFSLLIPYLDAGGAGPLRLPFSADADLVPDAAVPSVSRDVA
ncbi:hypothetical protein [Microbacterium sp. 10M-3C3]|jgi:hypothetical protein|uniref:hypothetical protein n=1 Tax=Microbacterium sp. 10M-3C3 TaxID=2483401 RepID=UPI000F641487|nr:hypothetical protein [Microbacterium sp. 10M-3C3]